MQRGPLAVLQSHGEHDSILPFPMGAALRDLLLEAGAEIDFIAFAGDHEIPPPTVSRLAADQSRDQWSRSMRTPVAALLWAAAPTTATP